MRLAASCLSAVVGCLLWAQSILAADEPLGEPQAVIERVSVGLLRVLQEDRARLEKDSLFVRRLVEELLLPNLDFRHTCALILGPYWTGATAAQRDAFVEEFKELLINTYATAVDELRAWRIEFLPLDSRPGAEDVLVRTRVFYPGGDPVVVGFRMHKKGGRWLVYDVEAAGIRFVDLFRSSFVRIARQKGVAGLIEELAQRNALRRSGAERAIP